MVSWVSLLFILLALSHYSLGQGGGSETETTIEWKVSKDDGIHTAETSVPNDKETTPQRTGTDNDRADTEATSQKIAPSYEEVTVETSTGS